MDSTVQNTQRKALYAWAWAIWIGFSAWPAYHSPMQETGFDWLLFALFVVAERFPGRSVRLAGASEQIQRGLHPCQGKAPSPVLVFNPALVRHQPEPIHHRLNQLIGISTSPSPPCGLFLACRQRPAARTGQTRASLASQPRAPGSTGIRGFLGRGCRRARNGEARCTAMQTGLSALRRSACEQYIDAPRHAQLLL